MPRIAFHENRRNTTRTPAAAVSCRRAGTRGTVSNERSQATGRFTRGGFQVENGPSARRTRFPEGPASSRPQAQTLRLSEAASVQTAAPGPPQARPCHRPMDAPADRPTDPPALWRNLQSLRRLEPTACDGMELSKARKTGPRRRRGGGRNVAARDMAAYKKRPEKAVKPLFSWMKAALCSSRLSAALGRRRGKRRCWTTGFAETDFRLFRPWRSRPNATNRACSLLSTAATSMPTWPKPLRPTCSESFPRESSWYGIGGRSTAALPGGSGSGSGNEWRLCGCRRMPPNSIRSNMSGATASTANWPTSSPTTDTTCAEESTRLWPEPKRKSNCFARSSIMQSYNYDAFFDYSKVNK